MHSHTFPRDILDAAADLLHAARARGLTVATAESCTGGLIAAALTEIAGSSDVVVGGFVSYANAAKSGWLDVPAALIKAHGAVSGEVAAAMAAGALTRSGADATVAVTGIAGPGGGSPAKPVGLVWFATARLGAEVTTHSERFGEIGRGEVRAEAVRAALRLLGARVGEVQAVGAP